MLRYSKDHKSFILYSGVLYLTIFLSYKIPHDSYSFIQALIKPIRNGNSVFYVSSLVVLALSIVGIIGFVNLKRFEARNKFLVFLLVVIIIIPFMNWSIDMTRSFFFWFQEDKLSAVDLDDSNLSLAGANNKLTLTVHLTFVDYSSSGNSFQYRIYLPESLSKYTGVDVLESDTLYTTSGNRNKTGITETFDLYLKDNNALDQACSSEWSYEDTTYELYNQSETVKIVDHGL